VILATLSARWKGGCKMAAIVLHDHPQLRSRWLCAWDPEDDWAGVLRAGERGICALSEVEGV
jgi:hypothetical protein